MYRNCDISVNRAIGFVSISAVLVIPFGTLVNSNDRLSILRQKLKNAGYKFVIYSNLIFDNIE
jgi:hypothetical protein